MASNRLGDLIPESVKRKFASGKIVPGSIIKALVGDTRPPKYKRFIIIGEDKVNYLLGTVYINSEVNSVLFKTKELKDLHIFFPSKNRDYLDHNSFVDCSQIRSKSKKEMEILLKDQPESYLGKVSEDDLKLIKQVTSSARTIDNYTKRRFGL